MDKEKFLEFIKNIGTTEDEAQRRELLTQLNDEMVGIFDINEKLTNENNTYKDDNEKLRSANMQLFLRVGTKSEDKKEEKPDGTKEDPEPRKFEDLFDEKGGIK